MSCWDGRAHRGLLLLLPLLTLAQEGCGAFEGQVKQLQKENAELSQQLEGMKQQLGLLESGKTAAEQQAASQEKEKRAALDAVEGLKQQIGGHEASKVEALQAKEALQQELTGQKEAGVQAAKAMEDLKQQAALQEEAVKTLSATCAAIEEVPYLSTDVFHKVLGILGEATSAGYGSVKEQYPDWDAQLMSMAWAVAPPPAPNLAVFFASCVPPHAHARLSSVCVCVCVCVCFICCVCVLLCLCICACNNISQPLSDPFVLCTSGGRFFLDQMGKPAPHRGSSCNGTSMHRTYARSDCQVTNVSMEQVQEAAAVQIEALRKQVALAKATRSPGVCERQRRQVFALQCSRNGSPPLMRCSVSLSPHLSSSQEEPFLQTLVSQCVRMASIPDEKSRVHASVERSESLTRAHKHNSWTPGCTGSAKCRRTIARPLPLCRGSMFSWLGLRPHACARTSSRPTLVRGT